MGYYQTEDVFRNRQPEKRFATDLTRPMHTVMPGNWNSRAATDDEVHIARININIAFADPEDLLEVSYADFRSFLRCACIEEALDGIPLIIRHGETPCKEAYELDVQKDRILLTAADTEGIRRGLIFIEDEMGRREGPYLGLGQISRKPFLATRISRCFFAPPSHNDNQGMLSELEDDIDYYPEAYLCRLMHDGINGLWIGANFRDLLKSDLFPEYGQDGKKRLEKLRTIIARCRKYGIGIYLFSVEPAASYRNEPFKKRKELHGGTSWAGALFCTSTDEFKAYIRESITRLFAELPDLKGFINITVGECLSGCGSVGQFTCPRCKEKYGSLAATLAATEKMFADIMKEVAPHAEFISWTYGQRGWLPEDFSESLLCRDKSVIHMQNFEDDGTAIQLGRKRRLFDYWLAYVGPGKVMSDSVSVNKTRGIKTFAKLQICTSFDFSTVPYVPAPGILFDKFHYMHDNDISGALLCWYFGNYPGLMNKAACELAFAHDFTDKHDFLLRLASTYWGSDAEKVVEAWEHFEESYKSIPLNKAFQWYSPMVDSPAAPLHLKPVDLPMPGSWKVTEMVGSDRVGESLVDGHTIEEAVTLTAFMRDQWKSGMIKLAETVDYGVPERIDQKVIGSAIEILIDSCCNIIRFYSLRRHLGIGRGDVTAILDEMEDIARREIENSRKLIPLCEAYPYLGYQSEANGFKFFKEKLLWRIDLVKKCLDEEFTEVRHRIDQGLFPLAFYRGEEGNARVCKLVKGDIDHAPMLPFLNSTGDASTYSFVCGTCNDDLVTLRFLLKDSNGEDSIKISPEFRMFHPSAPFTISEGTIHFPANREYVFTDEVRDARIRAVKCEYTCDGETDIYTVSFKRADLGMESGEPFRLSVNRTGKHEESLGKQERFVSRLIFGFISPEAQVFFVEE